METVTLRLEVPKPLHFKLRELANRDQSDFRPWVINQLALIAFPAIPLNQTTKSKSNGKTAK